MTAIDELKCGPGQELWVASMDILEKNHHVIQRFGCASVFQEFGGCWIKPIQIWHSSDTIAIFWKI